MTSYKKTEPNFYTVNEVQPDKAGNVNEAFHMSNMDGLDEPNTGSKAVVHINRALSESGQPPGCFVRRPVAITLVLLTVLIIAVVAVIMAMFGPGNVRLKYTSELSEPNDTPTKGEPTALPCLRSAAPTETTTTTKVEPTEGTTTVSPEETTSSLQATANTTVKPTTGANEEVEVCGVVVIGAGIGGLYTTEYLLSHSNATNETSVCVLEREGRLGGRIYDVTFEKAPNTSAGLGAWIFDSSENKNIEKLFDQIYTPHSYEILSYREILESRGVTSDALEDLKEKEIKKQVYPQLNTSKFQNMTVLDMLQYAFDNNRARHAADYATIETYLSNILSLEAEELISDIAGLKRHYDKQASPASYIEYYSISKDMSTESNRPIKGMAELVKALANFTKSLGGKIYLNSGVNSIEKDTENNFVVKTVNRSFKARKVVIATPPKAFAKVGGEVAQRIRNSAEFHSIQPVPAFKGAAVYNSAWWKNSSFALGTYEKYISNSDCLGMTLPYEESVNGTAVLTVMYTTGSCAQKWADIYQVSSAMLDREIHRALENKFRMKIPAPLESKYQYWRDGAWHYQKPGSSFTIADVEEWAKRPLVGEDVFLVGSAYHAMRGWCEGAIRSSQNALKEGWNATSWN